MLKQQKKQKKHKWKRKGKQRTIFRLTLSSFSLLTGNVISESNTKMSEYHFDFDTWLPIIVIVNIIIISHLVQTALCSTIYLSMIFVPSFIFSISLLTLLFVCVYLCELAYPHILFIWNAESPKTLFWRMCTYSCMFRSVGPNKHFFSVGIFYLRL